MPRLDKEKLVTGFMERLVQMNSLQDQLQALVNLQKAVAPKQWTETKPNPLSLQQPRGARGGHKQHCRVVYENKQTWLADSIRKLAGNETLEEWYKRQEREGWARPDFRLP